MISCREAPGGKWLNSVLLVMPKKQKEGSYAEQIVAGVSTEEEHAGC